MKRFYPFFVLLLLPFTAFGCKGEKPILKTEKDVFELEVGNDLEIAYTVENESEEVEILFSSDSPCVEIKGKKIIGVKAGAATIMIKVKGKEDIYKTITVNVVMLPITEVKIIGKEKLTIGEISQYKASFTPENASSSNITWSSSDERIFTVNEKGIVTALSAGTAILAGTSSEGIRGEMAINVVMLPITEVKIIGKEKLTIGEISQYKASLTPENAAGSNITWSSSDERIFTVNEKGIVTALGAGTAILAGTSSEGIRGEMAIKVRIDRIKPVIRFDESIAPLNPTINYNEDFDIMKGVSAEDNSDGDLTDKIKTEGTFDNHRLGKQKIVYTVKDRQGNRSEKLTRIIYVIWDYAVGFIGHAGCYSGLMNSAEAFENAICVHGYQLVEGDVKQTKDGVFVMSHGDEFNGLKINAVTYDELKKEIVTESRGGKEYTTGICSFKTFLEICRKHNVTAVAELKYSNGINKNDQSRMKALMDEIEACKMTDRVILLTSQYKCLEWTRSHGYSHITCQYLVDSCESEEILNRCIQNNFDISFNINNKNSLSWINRYHAAGLKVSCYTFTQYSTKEELQKWIDYGVDYVTVDKIKPYEVRLPKKKSCDPNKT